MEALNQAHRDGVVKGLKDVAGVADRLDVDELLVKHPETFNLFCLALSELMSEPESKDTMGYFQLAGIHGLPKALWDGVDANSKHSGGYGYCAHSRPTFPPWHRPYLAMVEQTLFLKMRDIAETFPEASKSAYREAAQQFRLPYWDYYRPRGEHTVFPGVFGNGKTSFKYDFSVPQIFTVDQIVLRTPEKGNELELRNNPFRLFDFPSVGSIPEREWSIVGQDSANFSRQQTQRYPFSPDPLKSMNDAINKNRESGVAQILNMVSDLAYKDYDAFAHDTAATPSSGSLEGIHGNYHVLIGGTGGHMSRVPVAAFDPIFWLHHCQIDRWFAVWQAVNGYQRFNTDQEDLLPFRSAEGSAAFWTSERSMDTKTFGYSYGDAVGSAQQVKDNFVANYGWSKRTSQQPTPGPAPLAMRPLDLSHAQVYQYNSVSVAKAAVHAAQAVIAQPVKSAKIAVTSARNVSGANLDLRDASAKVTKEQKVVSAAATPDMAVHGANLETRTESIETTKGQKGATTPPAITSNGASPETRTGSAETAQNQQLAPATPATTVNEATPEARTKSAQPTKGQGGVATEHSLDKLEGSGPKIAASAGIDESKVEREWFVDQVVQRLALNGAFTVFFFVGGTPATTVDTSEYLSYSTLAGVNHVFAAPVEACDNCGNQQQQAHLVSNTAPITPILLDYVQLGDLADLSMANVKPFLVKNLKWRILTVNGERVDPRNVPGLKIGVSSKLTPLDGQGQITYQEFPDVVEEIIERAS